MDNINLFKVTGRHDLFHLQISLQLFVFELSFKLLL